MDGLMVIITVNSIAPRITKKTSLWTCLFDRVSCAGKGHPKWDVTIPWAGVLISIKRKQAEYQNSSLPTF